MNDLEQKLVQFFDRIEKESPATSSKIYGQFDSWIQEQEAKAKIIFNVKQMEKDATQSQRICSQIFDIAAKNPEARQKISQILEQSDPDLNRQLDSLIESVQLSLLQSNDDGFYDHFIASKDKNIPGIKEAKEELAKLRAARNKMEKKLQKKEKKRKQLYNLQNTTWKEKIFRDKVSLLGILGCIFLAGLLFLLVHQKFINVPEEDSDPIPVSYTKNVSKPEGIPAVVSKPVENTKKEMPAPAKEPASFEKAAVVKIEKSPFSQIVAKEGLHSPKIEEIIKEFDRKKLFQEDDIFLLDPLYNQHFQDQRFRVMILEAMGKIKGQKSLQWLQSKIFTVKETIEKFTIVDCLWKFHDAPGRKVALQFFDQENDEQNCTLMALQLVKLTLDDPDLYQSLISKFYQLSQDSARCGIVSAIGMMNIKESIPFLLQILSDSNNSIHVRQESLHAIKKQVRLFEKNSGERASIVAMLSQLETRETGGFQKEIQYVLKFLGN